MQTRAWEENGARIAELIKDSDDLQHFADYFMNVAVVEKESLVGHCKLLLRGQEALFGHFAPSTTAVVELSGYFSNSLGRGILGSSG